MINSRIGTLGLLLSLGIAACAAAPPPTTSPPPSVLAPVNKAKDATSEAQQKALQLERVGSEIPPSPTPTSP